RVSSFFSAVKSTLTNCLSGPIQFGAWLCRTLALESLGQWRTKNPDGDAALVRVNHTVSMKQIKEAIDGNQSEHSTHGRRSPRATSTGARPDGRELPSGFRCFDA